MERLPPPCRTSSSNQARPKRRHRLWVLDLRSESQTRGIEADECYVPGPILEPPRIPDLAVEVVLTPGGIDKLEIYRGLRVPEVWFWQDGALRIYLPDGEAHRPSGRSRLLPELDPDLIVRSRGCASQTQAVRALRAGLRSPT